MRSPRGSVLLADDEEGILKTLGRALREEGHDVTATSSAAEAQRLLSERSFDVFVVDHRMPGRTGLEMIRDLAAAVPEGERPQVLMMTAHATVENAIEAMKLGAFDYLQKPFEVEELLARVRACGRRHAELQPEVLALGDVEVDFSRHEVRLAGTPVDLAPTEWRLLEFLTRRRGQTFSRAAILAGVWGYEDEPVESNVDLYVHYLRRKLGAASPIRTVRGVGYRIDAA